MTFKASDIILKVNWEGDMRIFLSTQITGGGITQKEDIGGWGNLSMLLPLQNYGDGWSGPKYRDGVMGSQFSISIRGFGNEMLLCLSGQLRFGI